MGKTKKTTKATKGKGRVRLVEPIKDETETIKLRYVTKKTLHVSTYKSSITFHTPGEIVWMTADDAERLGRAFLKMAALRRKIDRAERAKLK